MASLSNRWNQQLILCLYICHFILEPRNDNSMRKKKREKKSNSGPHFLNSH